MGDSYLSVEHEKREDHGAHEVQHKSLMKVDDIYKKLNVQGYYFTHVPETGGKKSSAKFNN